jgi:hypothetical protein
MSEVDHAGGVRTRSRHRSNISAHCPGTRARDEFVHACVHGEWDDAMAMIEGMLAEPWQLRGYQENRLREFLELLKLDRGAALCQ